MSFETRWTSGPWSVRDCPMEAAQTDHADDGRIKLIDFNDGTYEGTLAIVQTEESKANAHLIAAAPELYAELDGLSLNTLLGMIEDSGDAEMWAAARGFMERRHEVLSKARGE